MAYSRHAKTQSEHLETMLPDWLQQIAADCTEQERQSLKINQPNPLQCSPTTPIMDSSSRDTQGEREMKNNVNSIKVLSDSPVGDEWLFEYEIGAKTVGGAKRSIARICCDWNGYIGLFDFSIVSKDGKAASGVYVRKAV